MHYTLPFYTQPAKLGLRAGGAVLLQVCYTFYSQPHFTRVLYVAILHAASETGAIPGPRCASFFLASRAARALLRGPCAIKRFLASLEGIRGLPVGGGHFTRVLHVLLAILFYALRVKFYALHVNFILHA